MMTRSKVLFVGILALAWMLVQWSKPKSRNTYGNRQQRSLAEMAQLKFPTAPPRTSRRNEDTTFRPSNGFARIQSLYTLRSRDCEDHDLGGFIVQNDLIKKDPRLGYNQIDIDDCNDLVLSYVERGVRENGNYYLRRKLVETFGQTNQAVLVNRMRLVAVLLGGEKGQGGMDSTFTPIREEAHRFSPYVLVLIQDYIKKLEARLSKSDRKKQAPNDFRQFVDTLGDSMHSEYAIADIGRRQRNQPVKELYALKVLLRDLRQYYGEPLEKGRSYEVIFSEPGSFQSETFTDLKARHATMKPMELAKGFIQLGIELREHLSGLRDKRKDSEWSDGEEINHLRKLNEMAAALPGLFASGRTELEPFVQVETLIDLLFIEGLYSKKERKSLKEELDTRPTLGPEHVAETQAFYRFLNYISGLAHATMEEAFGEATRAFAMISPEAANYMEVMARKSALQVLGQLQQEFYQTHRGILAGKTDIHLGGTASGTLRVFRTQSEIAQFLKGDSLNGDTTIWVLKSGLNMPNEASFAAIILEDPIMKASHYDGYARSRQPPIPLLQMPNAAEVYAKVDGKSVVLSAIRDPHDKVTVEEISANRERSEAGARPKLSLDTPMGQASIIEIEAVKTAAEIRELQTQAGSKAANYAFLRGSLPYDKAKKEEHIYPGFAIPFHVYQEHVERCRADDAIASLVNEKDPEQVKRSLGKIRQRILDAPVSDVILRRIRQHIEESLKSQHLVQEEQVKLRFRSSSNAEDNQDFSGAGLYESHPATYTYEHGRSSSGEARDRNDQNVEAALKRVWASLWKDEAYRARERAGIVQETVRMGVLVHPSYREEESTGVVFYYGPDDIEIAVNKGNENVQNPSIAGLTPELHYLKDGAHRREPSSRFLLSGQTILSEKDRGKLMKLVTSVVPKFRDLYPKQDIPGVDIEFKVIEVPDEDGGSTDVIMLKQIRPLAKRAAMK